MAGGHAALLEGQRMSGPFTAASLGRLLVTERAAAQQTVENACALVPSITPAALLAWEEGRAGNGMRWPRPDELEALLVVYGAPMRVIFWATRGVQLRGAA